MPMDIIVMIPTERKKGMRGVFMYYWDATKPDDSYTGKNIFFPIGRSGYGHRKQGSIYKME